MPPGHAAGIVDRVPGSGALACRARGPRTSSGLVVASFQCDVNARQRFFETPDSTERSGETGEVAERCRRPAEWIGELHVDLAEESSE
jgi:hypothetical protein